MKFSCSSSMVPGKSLTEKANNLKKWGFDGITIFMEYSEWNDKLFEEIKFLKKNTGITPVEFMFSDPLYGHLMDPDPVIREKSREMYKKAVRVCAEVGAVTDIEYEYKPQDPLPMLYPYAKMKPDEEKEFLDMYKELVEAAKGSNAYVLLEPINRYEAPYLNSMSDCCEIVQKLNLSNSGLIADVFHLAIEEKSIPDAIRQGGSLIKHVHFGDNNRLLPGYGNLNWKEIINALKEIKYDGYLNLECAVMGDPAVELPKAVKYIRSCM